MADIFALVDCNNFYASCERLFQPSLEGRPVIVLSNNDGCVIARSEEAKAIGIKMGIPAFMIDALINQYQVSVFSTNYSLYGDISERIMNALASMVPEMEVYSIDEAFLDLSHVPCNQLAANALGIKDAIGRAIGIPVTVGLGPTKTLAKAANYLAKARKVHQGVMVMKGSSADDAGLKSIPVQDIWGVGEQYRKFFNGMGICTARDLKYSSASRVREHLGVPGQRLILELRGQVCYQLNDNPDRKKEICTSRSFGHPIESFGELEEATTSYAAKVAMKLRKQHSLANAVLVFVMTNKYDHGPKYVNFKLLQLPAPSNNTQVMIHHARLALKALFRTGYRYKKSGVIGTDLVPDNGKQMALWNGCEQEGSSVLNGVIDQINWKCGGDMVKYAVQGTGKSWKMKQHNLSPHYTTRWEDLLTINLDLPQAGCHAVENFNGPENHLSE
jgi:DNA polymerase V